MTLLIIEPEFDGHHYTYLEKIVEGALDRGIRVMVGTGDDSHGGRIRAALRQRFGDRVQFVSARVPAHSSFPPGAFGIALGELRHRRFLREVFRSATRLTQIDRVLLPFVDSALFAISLLGSPFGPVKFSGITMRQRFHFPARRVAGGGGTFPRLRERLFRRFLSLPGLDRVFTIDETLLEHFEAQGPPGSGKIVHFPDPSDAPAGLTQLEARDRLGLPAEGCVLLMYGFVDRRKGIARLLEWVTATPPGSATHLVIAGRQASDVPELFEATSVRTLRNEGRLHVFNEFIAPQDESTFFAAADLVWLAYDGFELMSSVLVKAAIHSRGVVYFDRGLIARYARRFGHERGPGELPDCVQLLSTLPPELTVRLFRRSNADPSLPDHSWDNALQKIYG